MFQKFLSYFPEVELPVALLEDTYKVFSLTNDPLPLELIQTFVNPAIPFDDDEFTEYIACFKLKIQENTQSVVIWRAGLMRYSYFVINYDLQGKILDREEVGGFAADNTHIYRKFGTIEADNQILIVEGMETIKDEVFNPADHKKYTLEILPDGRFFRMAEL